MAAITELQINTDRLNSDIQTLRNRLTQTRNHIARLERTMQSLDSAWSGPAKEAEQIQFEADRQNMLELCSLIEKLIANLQQIQKLYVTCENSVGDLVRALSVG